MLPILSVSQIRDWDKYTVDHEPIESVNLMARAGNGCVDWLERNINLTDRPIDVFAGVGNNGGDALVIAKTLFLKGQQVRLIIVNFSDKRSPDFNFYFDRLPTDLPIVSVFQENEIPDVPEEALIIDGVFGVGLTRAPKGLAQAIIKRINSYNSDVISIDIPSGLHAEGEVLANADIINADVTLTFQTPKLGLILPKLGNCVGQIEVLDIGLHNGYIESINPKMYWIDSLVEYRPKFQRKRHSHKGTYGKVAIVSGITGSTGATILCARAAVKSGVGLAIAFVPSEGIPIMQTSLPEAMCVARDDARAIDKVNWQDYATIAVGPGLGTDPAVTQCLETILNSYSSPIVIDADALNIISEGSELLECIPKRSILTPHPKEFARLFGPTSSDLDQLDLLKTKASELDCFIILKGAYSVLATPEGELFINSTGNPGMATGGSGDVLTGIVAGFLAQTKDPFISAICGMYIHGLAGDIGALEEGMHGLTPSDIISNLGHAMNHTFG